MKRLIPAFSFYRCLLVRNHNGEEQQGAAGVELRVCVLQQREHPNPPVRDQ